MTERDKQRLYLGSWVCQHCKNEVDIVMKRGDYNKIGFNFSDEELLQNLICPQCHKHTEMANADIDIYDPPIDIHAPSDKERVKKMILKSQERMLKRMEENETR